MARGKGRSRVETENQATGRKHSRVENLERDNIGKGKCNRVVRVKDSGARPAGTSTDSQAAIGHKVIYMPEDGSCLFHAVGHESCLHLGMDPPVDATARRQLAIKLRNKAVNELIKRKDFMAGFMHEDFDEYVEKMWHYEKWSCARELLMPSFVLEMPITVYKFEDPVNERGPLIIAAVYGEQFKAGKIESPIQVLYHSWGPYDVVQFDAVQIAGRSRL